MSLGRAAPELLLVKRDHRVGDVLQQPSAGLLLVLGIGVGVGHDRPCPLPLGASRTRVEEDEDPQAEAALASLVAPAPVIPERGVAAVCESGATLANACVDRLA